MAVNISYQKARFHRRCFACLLDFLVFAILFGLSFLACRSIVTVTPDFQQAESTILRIREESGLFYINHSNNHSLDIVSYLRDGGFDGYYKWNMSRKAIDTFIDFTGKEGLPDSQEKVQKSYDEYRLSPKLTYKGLPFFIKDEAGTIIENPAVVEIASLSIRFEQAYAPYIDHIAQAYLVTEIPTFNEATHYESNLLFFAEIIPAYAFAGLLTYLVPVLIFRRGRMTLGKFLYRIGTVDKRLLVPKMGRTLARFAIFYFGELLLTPFTFGIPFLVSFSLMAFTKDRQSFPDYMLKLYEVDISEAKIYFDKAEIRLSDIPGMGKPVAFKMEQEL
ncbi:MAG: RDD family protein [Bacilli bacterium]|nr:RDD family protein [Bacilli bacterium]